jgi:5-methylcytosine-specific restriction protein A
MANAPKKIKRPWVKEKVAFERPVDFSWFYNDRKWRRVSKAYREQNPICECEECKASLTVKPAKVCDHIKGLKYLLDNGLDPYDFKELQSMSNECHNKKSGKESHRSRRG